MIDDAKKLGFKEIVKKHAPQGIFVGVVVMLLVVWSIFLEVEIRPSQRMLDLVAGDKAEGPTPVEELTGEVLAEKVVPEAGYTVRLKWGETGKKLVESGAIDLAKYQKNYSDKAGAELMSYLTEDKAEGITINRENAYFWVNTLWALGLAQKSKVLDEGIMGTEYKAELGNFASTAGWTLGAKKGVRLYSSAEIIALSDGEQEMVDKIAQVIYRPCCGNPTSFPDCNHGMAILGLIELMVAQGFGEEEIYQAALAFNSYWFTQTYMDLAYYFETRENVAWSQVDPKRVLAAEFSSASGYQAIKKQIEDVPGLPSSGGSCGA